MKKIYSTPVMNVYEMRCEAVIAASAGVSSDMMDAGEALGIQKDMWGNDVTWE